MGICPPIASRRTTLQPHTEVCAIAATHKTRRQRSHFKRLSDSRYYQYRPGTAPQQRSLWASVFVTESLIARTYLSVSIRERQNVQSHSPRTVLN